MPRAILLATCLAIAALSEMGCAQLNLPQRGFATRYFVQTIEPRLRSDGQQDGAGEGHAALPSADNNIGGGSATHLDQISGAYNVNSKAAIRQKCVDVARNREIEAGYQGFDDDTQKDVFNKTLAECLKWNSR